MFGTGLSGAQIWDGFEGVIRFRAMNEGDDVPWSRNLLANGSVNRTTAIGRMGLRSGARARRGNWPSVPVSRRMADRWVAKDPRALGVVGRRYDRISMVPGTRAAIGEEIARKGLGPGGYLFGRPLQGINSAFHSYKGTAITAAIDLPLSILTAGKGHKVAAAAGSVAGISAGVVAVAAGTALGGPVLGLAAGLVADTIRHPVTHAVEAFSKLGVRVHHPEMGGNFQDTQATYTMRQRAAQEMSQSLLNARQYLGREAQLMHQ